MTHWADMAPWVRTKRSHASAWPRRKWPETSRASRLQRSPSYALAIEDTLKEHPAEFLHFFCFGWAEAGVSDLELATINDMDTGRANGSGIKVG